jgi:hypothetical protein
MTMSPPRDRSFRSDGPSSKSAAPRGKRPLPSAPAKDSPGIKNPYVRFRPLEKPRVQLHDTTLWDYPSQHYGKSIQGDPNYRGATPSHIVWNVISRFTKKGDLVVDPFVGSGTTLDVCRDLDRRGKGFDLATTRNDVVIADARTAMFTEVDADTAHLVFMDPPYADNLAYSDDVRCIGKRPFEDGTWSEAMGKVLDGAMRALKVGGHLACFVSDIMHVQQVKESIAGRSHNRVERRFGALGVEMARLALERGFTFVDHVAVVRHGKAMDDPRLKARAEEQSFMLRGFSHLLIFEKPAALVKNKWNRAPAAAAAAAPWTPRSAATKPAPPSSAPKQTGGRGGNRAKEREASPDRAAKPSSPKSRPGRPKAGGAKPGKSAPKRGGAKMGGPMPRGGR